MVAKEAATPDVAAPNFAKVNYSDFAFRASMMIS